MARKDLIKNEDLTPQQRQANARKAGKASAEKRRQKKKLKEAMITLMELPPSEANQEKMKAMGIDDSEMTNQMLIAVSALGKAIKGDVRAMMFIHDVMGGKSMNELDTANMERIKAETQRIKAETKKIEQMSSTATFDADSINELNKDMLTNVVVNRQLEDFE